MDLSQSNNRTLLIVKAMLIMVSVAFSHSASTQNIIANPDFNDIMKCCEVKQPHFVGWLEVKGFYSIQKNKKHVYLGASPNMFFIGSLIKPIHAGQKYTLNIKLDRRESFYLKYTCFQRIMFLNTMDTTPISSLDFKHVLIKNRRSITIEISPTDSFCNYIAFELEAVNHDPMGAIYFDSIELIDQTEKSETLLKKYYERINEIYSERRRHRFLEPCEEKTLSD